jgi:ubiquinone/menaquinone biosynthesis C-methylase UbiE
MKTSSLKKVREMYNTIADSYSKMMDSEIKLPVYTEELGRLQDNISDIPGALVDTSCGSGHMLAMFRSEYDSHRSLIGIDISPSMVEIAAERLNKQASIEVGDMRSLPSIESGTVAAVINFFAVHHLSIEGIHESMLEWNRVLVSNGRLLIAAWEGIGVIDYGEDSDIVALRYTGDELTEIAETSGFIVSRCLVRPVDGFPMDAVYLDCIKE